MENGSRLLFQKKDGWSWKQITWPDLATEVESIACFLLNSGFSAGSAVIVLSANTLSCLFFELAALRLGGTSLPASNLKEAKEILKDLAGNCFLLCSRVDHAQELINDPMLGEKVEKAFLSVNKRISVEEKIVSYSNVVKFGFLKRKKLKDKMGELGSLVKADSPAVIFNAGNDSLKNKSFSHSDILDVLHLSEQALGEFSIEDQTFSYLPCSGSFSKFVNLLNLQTAVRGAIAENTEDFFTDILEIMPVILFLSKKNIEGVVNRIRGKNGLENNIANKLGGRARLILTDALPSERTMDCLLAQKISIVELKSLSVVL